MSTEATLSTELGSNPLLSMYDKIEGITGISLLVD